MAASGKVIGFAILIWIIGFAWGSAVFMTPALKEMASIPYVSRYPAISAPLILLYPFITFWFAKICLSGASDPATAGGRVGMFFAGINVILDVLVLVVALKSGWEYFAFASIWLGYAILLLVPVWAGRRK